MRILQTQEIVFVHGGWNTHYWLSTAGMAVGANLGTVLYSLIIKSPRVQPSLMLQLMTIIQSGALGYLIADGLWHWRENQRFTYEQNQQTALAKD